MDLATLLWLLCFVCHVRVNLSLDSDWAKQWPFISIWGKRSPGWSLPNSAFPQTTGPSIPASNKHQTGIPLYSPSSTSHISVFMILSLSSSFCLPRYSFCLFSMLNSSPSLSFLTLYIICVLLESGAGAKLNYSHLNKIPSSL